ncbi:MAK10-like protein [Tanacetum coccineum]
MGVETSIRTLGALLKLAHEGIGIPSSSPYGTTWVPLRSQTLLVGAKGCSFHGLSVRGSKPTPQGFPKTRCITTWDDLTIRFLAQLFPPRRTAKLRNDILMFQQHDGESLSKALTRFKDLLQKVPHHGTDLWLKDLSLYDKKSWNDPRDFAKPIKAIALPQDVPSTSDRRIIKLENQVQRLMESHLAPTQPTQVNKITTPCEIYSGPHETQYCMEDPEQAFVEYASSRTDEAGVPPSSNTELICTKEEDGYVMFIKIIPKDDNSRKEEPEAGEQEVVYFDIFPTRSELVYHKIFTKNALETHDSEYLTGMDDEGEVTIWKAFGGNTRDLGSFGEETDKTMDLHQHLSRISTQKLETASQITRDAVTTHTKTASQDLKTAPECTTQPII